MMPARVVAMTDRGVAMTNADVPDQGDSVAKVYTKYGSVCVGAFRNGACIGLHRTRAAALEQLQKGGVA
jgi:hypothetical protein